MGGLCQTPVCRAGGGARLSVPLYPPGRDLQPATYCAGRARRHLPLQGLPGQGQHAPQNHDPQRQRVHASLPVARAARGLSPHPPLGLFANAERKANLAKARALLHAAPGVDAQPQGADALARQRSTDLRLPGVRCAHDHHRHLGARTTHPRATQTRGRAMSASTSRWPNRPPTLHPIEPIGDEFALRCDSTVSCPARHRTIRRNHSSAGQLNDIAGRLPGLISTFSPSAALQIPIAW